MNQLYSQINVKPDTPAEVIAAELTDLLANGLHKYLEAHPELIQKERCPTSGLDVCSVKLIFVRHHIDPAERGKRICACPPDVHPEDAWAEEACNLDCPLCGGSGHVDDVRRCKHCRAPMQPGVVHRANLHRLARIFRQRDRHPVPRRAGQVDRMPQVPAVWVECEMNIALQFGKHA